MVLNKFLEILGFGASDNEKKKVVDKAEKDAKKAVKGKKKKIANKAVKNDKEKKDKERKKIVRVPIPDSSRETSQEVWDLIFNSIYYNQYTPNSESGLVLEVYLHTANRPIFEQYQKLKNRLKQYLEIEGGYVVSKIVFAYGVPKNKTKYLQIERYDAYYRFIDKDAVEESQDEAPQPEVDHRAIIRAIPGKGLLKKDSYELSSIELRGGKSYTIGRGDDLEGGYRHNDIVVDENGGEKENCVSRAHARIGYLEGYGFYLQPEERGCLASGSRTRIIRINCQRPIDLENTSRSELLQNGDIIELAKAVLIKFELNN